ISWGYLAIIVAMGVELNVDVSAAAKLSGQLRDSERRTELASAAANVGMWTWEIVADNLWTTKRARALFDLPEAEPLDLARFLSRVHPDDQELVRRAVESSLTSGRAYEVEYRVQIHGGEVRWIAARGQVERNSQGKPILMRGAVLDTTERHKTELDMRQLQSQLAHVGRVSAMGQLASALAHELSQPLGAILRNAEAAELFLKHPAPDLDEVRAILADIRKDDQRAGDVIERLRALLKRRSIEPRAVDVGEVLSNVAALARVDAAARHITLEFRVTPGLPFVRGDRVHIEQVLLNLVLNAMDAVDAVPAGERRVIVEAERDGSYNVRISVCDSGTGVPPEIIGSIFEAFFTTKPNGMGMGLPISRTIIEAHGGRLWAENNAQRGATFRFTLPVAQQEPTSAS
ncbi:MAG: sensor histidine kinase, partial [Myxococcaceae bacterium]